MKVMIGGDVKSLIKKQMLNSCPLPQNQSIFSIAKCISKLRGLKSAERSPGQRKE